MKLGNNSRGRREEPFDVQEKDRHSSGGPGDRPDGTVVHGNKYRQPWITSDGVEPDQTSTVDGPAKKPDVG